ncbi:MAG: hypothetical protein SFU25_07935, partial [Candidatus Caenarcaniphilales bacterium]|nr:hypothetical protein [Candidatus Caenarcaniphilales bacterium]
MQEIITKENYSQPVQKLFELAEPTDKWAEWNDYLNLGIGSEHTDELLKILNNYSEITFCEVTLENGCIDYPYSYTPQYAWRILAQLKKQKVLPLVVKIAEEDPDEDSICSDLSTIVLTLGPDCIDQVDDLLSTYIAKATSQEYDLNCGIFMELSSGIERIGKSYPEAVKQCVE